MLAVLCMPVLQSSNSEFCAWIWGYMQTFDSAEILQNIYYLDVWYVPCPSDLGTLSTAERAHRIYCMHTGYSHCIYQVEEIQHAKAPWYQPGALSTHAQKICLAFPDKLQMLYHPKHWTSQVNVHVAMFFSGKITKKRTYRIPESQNG